MAGSLRDVVQSRGVNRVMGFWSRDLGINNY